MKKRFLFAALAALTVVAITGCGQVNIADYDKDAIVVKNDKSVTGVNVSSFEKAYYSEEELSEYINSKVDEYVSGAGADSIKVDEVKVEEQVAKAKITYKTPADYASFNNVDMFVGSVLDARSAGYEVPADIVKSEFATEEINETTDKALVVGQGVEVQVEGTICYTSSNVTVIDKNHAEVNYNLLDTEAQPGYIIYK